jgi:hypothetical protein
MSERPPSGRFAHREGHLVGVRGFEPPASTSRMTSCHDIVCQLMSVHADLSGTSRFDVGVVVYDSPGELNGSDRMRFLQCAAWAAASVWRGPMERTTEPVLSGVVGRAGDAKHPGSDPQADIATLKSWK